MRADFNMKINFLFFLLALGLFILTDCQNDGSGNSSEKRQVSYSGTASFEGPYIMFDTTCVNFGRVYEGERVGAYFKFKNFGNKNLVLMNVKPSCGCTIAEFNIEPIPPGREGEIKVVFDTEGRSGINYKSLGVVSNDSRGEVELIIMAEVIKK